MLYIPTCPITWEKWKWVQEKQNVSNICPGAIGSYIPMYKQQLLCYWAGKLHKALVQWTSTALLGMQRKDTMSSDEKMVLIIFTPDWWSIPSSGHFEIISRVSITEQFYCIGFIPRVPITEEFYCIGYYKVTCG